MPQLRKFEQDAIVNQTVAIIIENKEEIVATLKATPEYQGLQQKLNSINDLRKQSKALDKKARLEREEFEKAIEVFNEDVLNSNPIYKLEYNEYSYIKDAKGLSFKTDINADGGALTTIQDKIALALLPKEAVNDIDNIISKIADSFKIQTGGN
jgi:hypothetical protein